MNISIEEVDADVETTSYLSDDYVDDTDHVLNNGGYNVSC